MPDVVTHLLAPDGAILKRSAATPSLFEKTARAVVFTSLEDMAARVDDPALDEGVAVALPGEGQPVEPGGPSGIEVPLEPDLVLPGVGMPALRCLCFAHEPKLGADVVSRHHPVA